jgi:predicted Zn finger-like uncharacterized protein
VKLSCPSCGAKYSIADEKVQDRLAKIRCRKCSATIIVDGKVNPPSVYTSDAAAAPGADAGDPGGGAPSGGTEYSVDFGDNDQRTMTIDDIAHAYHRGELSAETYVWAEGFSDWQPISAVPELVEALGGADAGAAAPRTAARTGAGRGSAHDLFGGIATAGSEEDVMTSAPQAAAPPAGGATTGARNESSVLFSLSALTASAPAAPSITKSATPSAVSNGKDDDSGLIDLKALTSSVSNQPAGQLVLGTAPLGMAAPLGGMTSPAISMDGPTYKPASSKTGIYIAAAMVLVGALIAGAIVVTGNKEAPAAANPPVAAPVAPPPPPTAEVKKEEPTAAPPATGTAEAAKDTAAKAAGAPKATAHYAAKKPSSSSASLPAAPAEKPVEKSSSASSDTSSDAPKKPKKPKEKTCNCGPGDLMCAMKCAAS